MAERKTTAENAELLKQEQEEFAALQNERSSWDPTWGEVRDYLLPWECRLTVDDVNRGQRRDAKIIDPSVTLYADAQVAGMMAYSNPESSQWFEITLADTDLARYSPVKVWLADCTKRMHTVIREGNTYQAFQKLFRGQVGFGTAVSIVERNFDKVLWHHPVVAGRFWLATDWLGEVATCYREFSMTCDQMIREFGKENCSTAVQNSRNKHARFTVLHAIKPRLERDKDRRDGLNKQWASIYFEPAAVGSNKILREDGFDYFPVLAPRYDPSGGDVYGVGPGIKCLGNIKSLQIMAEQELKAVEYGVEPPLTGDTGTKDRDINRLPGGFTPSSTASPNSGIREMWKVNLNLEHHRLSKLDIRDVSRQTFHADLFYQFVQMEGDRRTAEEIRVRKEQQMLLLGPTVSTNQREKDGPFILMLFSEMMNGGGFGPPPPELSGATIGVKYVSILARAQQQMQAGAAEQYMFMLGQVATFKPDVLDNVNADKWANVIADLRGVDPDIIVPGREIALIRKARAQAQQAKEQSAMMEQQAKTMQSLGKTPVGVSGQPNALDALGQLTGLGA